MRQIISVKVKPQAAADKVEKLSDGSYLIQTKAPARDGKANAAVIKLLARHVGCAQSKITIKSGGSARYKLVIISG